MVAVGRGGGCGLHGPVTGQAHVSARTRHACLPRKEPLKPEAASCVMPRDALPSLLESIRACRRCEAHLPLGPRPVVVAHRSARVLIAGQAPGARVHASGVPWDDPSGARLREWLGTSEDVFYDAHRVALVPMGFCYPGRGPRGDHPPRPECAREWHGHLLPQLSQLGLTVVIGKYAQAYHLRQAASVTDTVAAWRDFLPSHIPLPHPSPRNNPWLRRHPWFEAELLPELRERVAVLLSSPQSR